MGVFFNAFIRHANVVKMANLAQLVNVIAPIFTNKQGLYLQTIYFPLVEYGKQRSNLSVDTLVKTPEYQPNGGGRTTGYLDVSTTYDPKGHLIYVNVLNRSANKDITASIENVEGKLSAQAELWQMDNPDLKAVNTFGDDHKVRPITKAITLPLSHNDFQLHIPETLADHLKTQDRVTTDLHSLIRKMQGR